MAPKIQIDKTKLKETLRRITDKTIQTSKGTGAKALQLSKGLKNSLEERLRTVLMQMPAFRDSFLPLNIGDEVPYLPPLQEITEQDFIARKKTCISVKKAVNTGNGTYLSSYRFQNPVLKPGIFFWWGQHLETYRNQLLFAHDRIKNDRERKQANTEIYKNLVLNSMRAIYVPDSVLELAKKTNVPHAEIRKILEEFTNQTKKETIDEINWEKEAKRAVVIEVSKKVIWKSERGMKTNVVEPAIQIYEPYEGKKEFRELQSITELVNKEKLKLKTNDIHKDTAAVLEALAKKYAGRTVHILYREDSNNAHNPRKVAGYLKVDANRFFSEKDLKLAADIIAYKTATGNATPLSKRIKKYIDPIVPELNSVYRPLAVASGIALLGLIGVLEIATIERNYTPGNAPVSIVKQAVDRGVSTAAGSKRGGKPKRTPTQTPEIKNEDPTLRVVAKDYRKNEGKIQVSYVAEDKWTKNGQFGAVDKVGIYLIYQRKDKKTGELSEEREKVKENDYRRSQERRMIEDILESNYIPKIKSEMIKPALWLVAYDNQGKEAKKLLYTGGK